MAAVLTTPPSDPTLASFIGVFPQSTKNLPSSMVPTFHDVEKKCRDYSWYPKEKHDVWITSLVVHLLECYPPVKSGYLSQSSIFGRHLIPLARKVPDFCQVIFPGLVHDLLLVCREMTEISAFFRQYSQKESEKCDQECVKTMLQLIAYLRSQSLGSSSSKWNDHFWIKDLDYLQVAYAAFQCQEYTVCIAYCDVWCYTQLEQQVEIKTGQAIGSLSKSLIDAIDENEVSIHNGSKLYQTLLADSYLALNEPFAVQGCGSRRNLDLHSHLQHLLGRKESTSMALAMFDAHLNQVSSSTDGNALFYQKGLLTAMEETGLHHTLQEYQKTCQQKLTSWTSLDFEQNLQSLTGLLLGKLQKNAIFSANFKQSYFPEKNVGEKGTFENQLNCLTDTGNESKNGMIIMTQLYDNLANLQIINELRNFHGALNGHEDDLESCLKKLSAKESICEKNFMDYQYVKKILQQRCRVSKHRGFILKDM